MTRTSYRQILRASSIIGGASIINVALGLLRIKAAALLLGPAGVGLIGIFQNLIQTASTLASLGFGTVGTRQIAEANGKGDDDSITVARRALFWGTAALAIAGAAIFWSLRGVLAIWIFDDAGVRSQLGWLALGVALTVAAASQSALLTGLRRIVDLAKISIGSALLGSAGAILALSLWGESGLVLFVLASPAASFAIGHFYVSRLPRPPRSYTSFNAISTQWKTMATLGVAFTVAGVSVTAGQLAARTIIQRDLGAEALGHFQAAWMISVTYIGFVLQAMGADYYPRLAAAINDHSTANRIVNEQSEIALLIAGPILLATLGGAPWVVQLLYSNAFEDAVGVLRWQILGDLFKIASWPLGYLLLASGDGRTFMLAEMASITIFVTLTALGLPFFGIQASGLAVLAMYAFYLPLVFVVGQRKTGFLWNRRIVEVFAALLTASIITLAVAHHERVEGALIGLTFAAIFAVFALLRLEGALPTPISKLIRQFRRRVGWNQPID